MPHLLATGNPTAEFSGFGHEGSGVKLRGWEPFAHHPKSVIQALRMEISPEFETYYGYFYDDRTDRWKLYTVVVPLRMASTPSFARLPFAKFPDRHMSNGRATSSAR